MRCLKYIYVLLAFLLASVLFVGLIYTHFDVLVDYLFLVIDNAGVLFSFLLITIFVLGAYVIFDRFFFFANHLLLTRKMMYDPNCTITEHNVFHIFLNNAREFRAVSEEGVYSDEIIDHAREAAMTSCLDSQEIDWGRAWLEFLGIISPTVGFIGTMVGLIASFQEMAAGGRLAGVLQGLALSMTTSLMGATISVIFLSSAWLLGRLRRSFDNRLYKMIALAQQSDRT